MYCIHVSNLQLNFLRNTIKQKNWSHYIKLPSALEFLAIHSSAKLLLPCPITNPQFIQSSKDCNQCKIRPQNLLQLESVHFVKQPTLFILGLTKMWFLIFKQRFDSASQTLGYTEASLEGATEQCLLILEWCVHHHTGTTDVTDCIRHR